MSAVEADIGLGGLLRHWRRIRGKSQLDLAGDARTTPRYVSFVETGRAQPSRQMVVRLARALDVPLRERNALLLAAGYAPLYAAAPLDSPELERVDAALRSILAQHEPFPAVVMDRGWNVLRANDVATRLFGGVCTPDPVPDPANVLALMVEPDRCATRCAAGRPSSRRSSSAHGARRSAACSRHAARQALRQRPGRRRRARRSRAHAARGARPRRAPRVRRNRPASSRSSRRSARRSTSPLQEVRVEAFPSTTPPARRGRRHPRERRAPRPCALHLRPGVPVRPLQPNLASRTRSAMACVDCSCGRTWRARTATDLRNAPGTEGEPPTPRRTPRKILEQAYKRVTADRGPVTSVSGLSRGCDPG
jgi:transcriptional regulator with XRE-family HTH domain